MRQFHSGVFSARSSFHFQTEHFALYTRGFLRRAEREFHHMRPRLNLTLDGKLITPLVPPQSSWQTLFFRYGLVVS